MIENNPDRPSSPSEWQMLKWLKLGLFAVGLIFFFHLLPGNFAQEAFPLMRWSMFSVRIEEPDSYVRRELKLTTVEGDILYMPFQNLYSGTALANNGASQEMIARLVRPDELNTASLRQAIFDRLATIYGVEIQEFDLIEYWYAIPAIEEAYFDLDREPDIIRLIATITQENTILHIDIDESE